MRVNGACLVAICVGEVPGDDDEVGGVLQEVLNSRHAVLGLRSGWRKGAEGVDVVASGETLLAGGS